MDDPSSHEHAKFQKIERIFNQVCNLKGDLQEQRLAELCDGDPDVYSILRSMLHADTQTSAMMDADLLNVKIDDDNPIPETIGEFKIIRVLGQGGMGIVYEATQESPKRNVALKVIQHRSIHDKIRKRFEREADILAKLNHPAIATIYESGIARDNSGTTPFVSMELVLGETITDHCDHKSLNQQERVALLRDVSRGVAHAHSLGIVHRDLKPSNILVDRKGNVKILDFGIAFDMEIVQRTQMTQTGQLLGTLQYMAPEQVDKQSHVTNTQTDVYTLGLIGYELLIGNNPLSGHDSSMYELVRAIRDQQHDLLGTHDRSLRGDIQTIVAKALSREIDQRYPDAGALADDLERYLLNQPIEARPLSTWYQFRKFSQRNPVLVGSVALVILILSIAVLLTGNALRTANRERGIAKHEQEVQMLLNAFVTDDLFASGNPEFGGKADISLLDAMRTSAAQIEQRFANAPEAEALIRFTMGDQFRIMNDHDEALLHLTKSIQLSESLDLPIDVVIDRRNSLADVYMDIDELDTALKLVEVTNQLAVSSPEVSPEIVIDTLVQHASLLYHMVDAHGAAKYFEQAVQLGRAQAPEYNGTVDAISALAIVYTRLQRYEESIQLHHEGIALRIQSLGPEHPATLVARDNLAIHFLELGEFKEAELIFRDVLAIRKRVFGNTHTKTYLTSSSLGISLSLQDEFDQAEQLLVQAYEGLLNSLGPEHRYTIRARRNTFNHFTRAGNTDAAELYISTETSKTDHEE